MQILQKTNYGLGKFLVTAVLAVLILMFLVIPKFGDYRSMRAELKAEQDLEKRLQAEDVEITKRLQTLQEKKDGVALLEMAIPSDPSIPDLYAHLETLVKTSNLTLTSIQAVDQTKTESRAPGSARSMQGFPGLEGEDAQSVTVDSGELNSMTSAPAPNMGVVTVNMDAIGDMNGYKQFLTGLETTLRIIDVQSVEVNTDEQGKLRFRVVLKTYYQKDK
jgi:Tfp pilus assembly protein PilO